MRLPAAHTSRASSVFAVGLLYRRHTEMVCGVHLGILLAVFCQAEYVRCSWAAQAQSSQRQNSNGYVGLSKQDSELRRLGADDPQNRLRQASVSPVLTPKSSASSQGPFSSSYSQPAQSAAVSVRFVQSNSLSKPNWQKPKQVNAPKKYFRLSTAIASGNSVSKYNKAPTVSKKITLPVQQSARQYPSSSSASLHAPSSKSSKFSSNQRVPSAAAETSYYGRGGASLSQKPSSLFSPRAPSSPRHSAVRMQTSATAPARRVSVRRTSKVSRPATFLPAKTNNGQAGFQPRSLQRYSSTSTGSQGSSWNRSPAQGAQYQPASGNGDSRNSPVRVLSIPERFGGFEIRRLRDPVEQRKVSATKPLQAYAASSGPVVSYKPQAQSYKVPSSQAASYKPQVQSIREPVQTQAASYKPQVQAVRKPQQTPLAPSAQILSYKPQQNYAAPSAYKPQQSYAAPSAQTMAYKPQIQSDRKPQQVQTAPSVQIVSFKPQSVSAKSVLFKPQAQSAMKPQQSYSAQSSQTVSYKPQAHASLSEGRASYKPQQTYSSPSAQKVSYKPQVQSVQQESRWKRIQINQ